MSAARLQPRVATNTDKQFAPRRITAQSTCICSPGAVSNRIKMVTFPPATWSTSRDKNVPTLDEREAVIHGIDADKSESPRASPGRGRRAPGAARRSGGPKLSAEREAAVRAALAAGTGIRRTARLVGTGNATVARIAAEMRGG